MKRTELLEPGGVQLSLWQIKADCDYSPGLRSGKVSLTECVLLLSVSVSWPSLKEVSQRQSGLFPAPTQIITILNIMKILKG